MIKRYLKSLFDYWWLYCALEAVAAIIGWILVPLFWHTNYALFVFAFSATLSSVGLLYWRLGHLYDAKVRKNYRSGSKSDIMESAFDAAAFCIPVSLLSLAFGIIIQLVW